MKFWIKKIKKKIFNKTNISPGFTIVELLVVVVIIGILASITVVSYSGISQKAKKASLISDLASTKIRLTLYKSIYGTYPTSLDVNNCPTAPTVDSSYCLKSSVGNTYANYNSDGTSFSIKATDSNDITYIVTDDQIPQVFIASTIASSFVATLGGADDDRNNFLVQTSDNGYAIAGETNNYLAGTNFIAKYASDSTLSWSRAWGNANDNSYVRSFIKTSDGGFVITGETSSYGAGEGDVFLAKYSNDGTLLWSRTWGGTGYEYASSIIQTSDNGYAIAGETWSFGAGISNAFLIKYTSDGTLSWNKTWGGISADGAYKLTQTIDSGYIIAGSTQSYDAGWSDVFSAKFTSDGTLSWSRTWGGTGNESAAYLIRTSDGGYAIAGKTASFGSSDGKEDTFLIKYTSDGTLSWNKTWGGANYEVVNSLIQTDDGGYALAGSTNSFGAGGHDIFLAKYNNDGTLSWRRTWGGTGDEMLDGAAVQSTDGGYILAGSTYSYGIGNGDTFLLKFTNDGTLSWNKTWGGADTEYPTGIILLSDGSYAVSGATWSYGGGSTDGFLTKYTDTGIITNCLSPMCQSPTATVTSPAANASPVATTTSPTATTTSPISNSFPAINSALIITP